jgi:hypothetical protein
MSLIHGVYRRGRDHHALARFNDLGLNDQKATKAQ